MKLDAIIIGPSTIDTFIRTKQSKIIVDQNFTNNHGIAFPLGEKLTSNIYETKTGGGGLNIATTFSNFGYKTKLITVIGKDELGKIITNKIDSLRNLMTNTIIHDIKKPTSNSCILLANNSERTIISNHKSCNKNLKIKKSFLKDVRAQLIFTSSLYGKKTNWNNIINYKKSNPKTIWCANPNLADLTLLKNNLSILKYIDCFFINQEEASYLSNIDYNNELKIFKFIDKYIKGICVMTKGTKGLSLSDNKHIYSSSIYKHIKEIDHTGAGDAFASGFSMMFLKTKQIEYSIKFGLANAANVVEKVGANTNILTPTIFNKKTWKKHFNKLKITKTKLC